MMLKVTTGEPANPGDLHRAERIREGKGTPLSVLPLSWFEEMFLSQSHVYRRQEARMKLELPVPEEMMLLSEFEFKERDLRKSGEDISSNE